MDTEVLLEQARSSYERLLDNLKALEGKAIHIFTVCSALLAGVFAASRSFDLSLLYSLPAMAALLSGVVISIRALTPVSQPIFDLASFYDRCKHFPNRRFDFLLALNYYGCEVGLRVVSSWKSALVVGAMRCAVIGLLLFLLPLFVRLGQHSPESQPAPMVDPVSDRHQID